MSGRREAGGAKQECQELYRFTSSPVFRALSRPFDSALLPPAFQ